MNHRHFIFIALLVSLSCSFVLTSPPVFSFAHDKIKSKLNKYKKKIKEQKKSVDLATGHVTKKDEISIGRNVISGLLGAAPLVDNSHLQIYVNEVGYWVAHQSKRPELPWTFGVINSANVNALASPGGYVVVTLGLYQLLENESQLAAILAHEISHVIEKHHLDAIRDTSKKEILGALAVRASSRKHREKMQQLVNSSLQIYTRGLAKKYEFIADRRGIVLAARAGYDPYALMDVLTTLSSINTVDDAMTVFLNTHPPLTDRISILELLMDQHLEKHTIPNDNQRLQTVNRAIASKP